MSMKDELNLLMTIENISAVLGAMKDCEFGRMAALLKERGPKRPDDISSLIPHYSMLEVLETLAAAYEHCTTVQKQSLMDAADKNALPPCMKNDPEVMARVAALLANREVPKS